MTEKKNTRKILFIVAKFSITLVLIAYIISKIELADVADKISEFHLGWVLLAVVVHFMVYLLMSTRWWLVLHSYDRNISYPMVFPSYLIGVFFNNFLPTAMGGDVVRILDLRRRLNTQDLVSSTIIDRVLGLTTVIVLGVVGMNISDQFSDILTREVQLSINIAVGILFILALLAMRMNIAIPEPQKHGKISSIINILNRLITQCKDSFQNNLVVATAILFSLAAQLTVVCCYYVLALSLGINTIAFMDLVLIIPVVFLLASLPISVGGLGIRETVLITLLVRMGEDVNAVTALSIVYLSVMLIVSLPGGILYLLRR